MEKKHYFAMFEIEGIGESGPHDTNMQRLIKDARSIARHAKWYGCTIKIYETLCNGETKLIKEFVEGRKGRPSMPGLIRVNVTITTAQARKLDSTGNRSAGIRALVDAAYGSD